jgi:IS30 family transposase
VVDKRLILKKLNQWFESVPKNLFKSITFDCGKEFSNWKQISNVNDIAIYFADPGTPSQRGLNENSNGLLRRDGLLKSMDFNSVDEFLFNLSHLNEIIFLENHWIIEHLWKYF